MTKTGEALQAIGDESLEDMFCIFVLPNLKHRRNIQQKLVPVLVFPDTIGIKRDVDCESEKGVDNDNDIEAEAETVHKHCSPS